MVNSSVPTKLAACDPCRHSKLACDHARPVCGRCRSKGQSVTCEYRSQPFKKQKTIPTTHPPLSVPRESVSIQPSSTHLSPSASTARQYPNPGYLGNSSHTTIFQNLSPAVESDTLIHLPSEDAGDPPVVESDCFNQAVTLVSELCRSRLELYVALVDYWIEQSGVNLPLAAEFVIASAQSTKSTLNGHDAQHQGPQQLVGRIFRNSCKPLNVTQASAMTDLVENFSGANVRWETIGIFFTAVSRASIDVQDFPPLLTSTQDAESLKRLALRYADRCLDISLSMDCLNDVQLVLQYENFINHSFVNGDQSYHCWKRLGDVISSILALGYHEKIKSDVSCPDFLVQLRQAVVARAYSADKNVSIFLGRPPRMIRKFCNFDFLDVPSTQSRSDDTTLLHYLGWTPDKPFDYTLDTWWSFRCALLKEEILDLCTEKDCIKRLERSSEIKERAQAQWKMLPGKYRYSGDLKLHHYKSIERDFIASTRLNYMHTLFMLRQASLQNANEPDPELLSICAEILNLTGKTVIMKTRLTNSGTGLIWKICHYGLPAAGVLCLALLHSSSPTQPLMSSRSRVLQDLSILVAHVDSGILIDPSDPDYALLAAATRSIQTILDKVLTSIAARAQLMQEELGVSGTNRDGATEDWLLPLSGNENWDFEVDFWMNLVEHPLLNTDLQTT